MLKNKNRSFWTA